MSKRAKIISVLITFFWLVMFFILIKEEYFPETSSTIEPGYKNMLKDVKEKDYSSFTVYYGTRKKIKIGRIVSVIEPQLDGTFDIFNQIKISITAKEQKKLENFKELFSLPYIKGKSIDLGMQTQSRIGPDYQLKSLDFRFKSNIMDVKLEGAVRTGKLYMKYNQGEDKIEEEIPLKTNTIIPDGMNIPSKLNDLKKGKNFIYKWFDPVTRSTRETKIEVLGKKDYRWHDKNVQVQILNITTGPIKSAAWVDLSGNLLKYEGLSFTLIKDKDNNPQYHSVNNDENQSEENIKQINDENQSEENIKQINDENQSKENTK